MGYPSRPLSRSRTNICLNMIVKNEAKVLPRLFRSLEGVIDCYVIVDTGSTDETIDLIGREMGARGIPGEVHEREWVNFGVNRQEALELAVEADQATWLLFIDADEELGVSDSTFYEKLEPGVSYELEKHHAGVRYAVPHLIDVRSARWKWEGPVHNYLVHLGGSNKRERREDVWIVYHSGEGAKSQGKTPEEKFLRDAELLEQDLKQNPDHARSQFYLGQSYKHAGRLETAREAYAKRVRMKGWAEEAFMAQLEVGRIAILLDEPEDLVLKEVLGAYEMRPMRVEPVYELARYFRLKKQYGKAYVFGRAGVQLPKPNDALFVAQSVYDWRMLDELGTAAYWVGDYGAGKAACEEILDRIAQGVQVPESDVRRIRDNLGFSEAKLKGG